MPEVLKNRMFWLLKFLNFDVLLYSSALFLLPVYEVDTVLRVSLLLIHISIISHLVPSSTRYLSLVKPVSQLGLFALLWSLPVNLLPSSVVNVYSLALELLGPVLVFLEVLFVIVLATDLFNYLTDLADDEEDDNYKSFYEGIITTLFILFYATASYIIFTYFDEGWLPLVILAVTIFNSFLMWVSRCGQAWEGGVTFLLSTVIFLALLQERNVNVDVRDAFQTLSGLNPKGPLREFISSLWIVTFDKFQQVRTWIFHFFTPAFVVSFFIRLFSVNWLILNGPAPSEEDGEDGDKETDIIEEGSRSWFDCQPALISTLSTIVVLTQLICDHFYELTGRESLFHHDLIKTWLPDQPFGRILQIVLANVTLQHSIYRRWRDDDTRDSYSDY